MVWFIPIYRCWGDKLPGEMAETFFADAFCCV